MKVELLRLQLPPWPGGEGEASRVEVRCGWREPGGDWHDGGARALDAVARDFQTKRLELSLHPADAPMASFTLPPLSGRRLHAAVQGAIEPCALQPLDALVTAFGQRGDDGNVPAAWTGRGVMDGWMGMLRRHGLPVRELQLPAAFLQRPEQGWNACLIDGWIVVRTGAAEGFMQWLPEGTDRAASLATLAGGEAALPNVQWVDDDDVPERWSGQGWGWSLQASDLAVGRAAAGMALAKPVVGWAVLAIAVWLTGLNVYAARLATQGQALKRQMAARVKAAFPDVPVVVNPLQQTRQQLEARSTGTPQGAITNDYAGLSRAAVNLLAQTPPGQVQGLRYTAGELRIQWRDGAAPNAQARQALQAQGKEQGLAVADDAGVLRVTAAPVAEPGKDAQ